MCRIIFILSSLVICCAASGQSYDEAVKTAGVSFDKKQFDSCSYYFNLAFSTADPKPADLYNAAVCNSLGGRSKAALSLLKQSIDKGINVSKLNVDPDLEPLHKSRQWKKLQKQANKKQAKELNTTQYPNEAKLLAKIWEQDQYLRFRLGKAYDNNDTIAINQIWKQLKPVDSVNLLQLQAIMDKIGWPTADKVGSLGASTAFLVIQHAPREIMEKYFPLLETAAKNGQASLKNFATMKDRVLVNRGKKQIYATQKYWDAQAGKFVYFDIEDESQVNTLRKQVGLDPLPDFK